MKGASTMKRIALAAVIGLSALSLFGLDLTGTSFTQTGERTMDGKTVAILADASGGELLLEAEAEPAPERLLALQSLVAEVRSWDNFEPVELRAVNMAERLQLTAIPRKFVVEGVDLAPAIPGGVQLLFKTATEYDFKVRSGKFVVRVGSVFTDLGELEAAALAAFKDPSGFIATRDPLYVQKRLDELFDRADAIEAKQADFETRVASLEKATFGVVKTPAKDESGAKAQESVAQLKEDLLALDAKSSEREKQMTAQWTYIKQGLLTALNGGKPIRDESVARLVELKKADPSLDKKNAPKALKTAGVTLTPSEISAIFLVEFGEK